MASDQFDNKDNNGKGREITQDRRNVSSNMGKKQEPASLSFDFDNKPFEEPDGLSFVFDNKPPAKEEVPESAPIEAAPAEEPAPAPEPPKKQYGLPADYSRSQQPMPVKAAAPKAKSEFSKKVDSVKTAIKKKIAEQQDARRAAKAAEAERQRLLAREEEVRKAEEARLAAEAAKRAEEERLKAEHQAKLEAAVFAEMEAAKEKR